jgi:hypothetical protein
MNGPELTRYSSLDVLLAETLGKKRLV